MGLGFKVLLLPGALILYSNDVYPKPVLRQNFHMMPADPWRQRGVSKMSYIYICVCMSVYIYIYSVTLNPGA